MRLTDQGHLLRLQAILMARALDARIRPGSRRGTKSQVHRRRLEGTTRQVTATLARRLLLRSWPRQRISSTLGISPQTLRNWLEASHESPPPRGRPARHADAETSQQVFAVLQLGGPGTGIPYLQALFPELNRAELHDLRGIYQRDILQEHKVLVHALDWRRPGVVWAMDHAHAPSLAEGDYRHLLVVRDLGSGRTLLALPVESQDARSVLDALHLLFLRHGPPLVLKSDNGSAFIAEETKEFLAKWGVEQLLSPPGLPSYNGAVEAGIGSLRAQAHYESAHRGRVGAWTCDDVEAARQRCNLIGRPRGRRGPNPQQLWATRTPVHDDERQRFRLSCSLARWQAACRRGACEGVTLNRKQRAAIEREAITESLIGHEHLVVRKGWISQPVRRRRARKIS